MNVIRQRRKEEHQRNIYAMQSRMKREKSGRIIEERNKLWEERRQTGVEAYRARELIKSTIMDMKVIIMGHHYYYHNMVNLRLNLR